MSEITFDPQSRKCLMCGSDRLRTLRARAFDGANPSTVSITECEDCVFAWQYPLGRTEVQSVEYFEAAYGARSQSTCDYFDADRKREIAKLEFDFLARLPVESRRLLDIGAGAGIFAEVAAEHGFVVTAVDPAIELDRFKEHRSIRAIRGKVEQIPAGEVFDIVTLWDVIEHATNPVQLMHDARGHLKEGGWLVIETGNYKSATRLSGGARHWIYQLDHRWYFSPESLERLLADSGFSEFVYSDRVLRPGWGGSADYAGPTALHLIKSAIRSPLHLRAHLSTHAALTRARQWNRAGLSIFAVAARRPGHAR